MENKGEKKKSTFQERMNSAPVILVKKKGEKDFKNPSKK